MDISSEPSFDRLGCGPVLGVNLDRFAAQWRCHFANPPRPRRGVTSAQSAVARDFDPEYCYCYMYVLRIILLRGGHSITCP